jgi:hypothetical protein
MPIWFKSDIPNSEKITYSNYQGEMIEVQTPVVFVLRMQNNNMQLYVHTGRGFGSTKSVSFSLSNFGMIDNNVTQWNNIVYVSNHSGVFLELSKTKVYLNGSL